MPRYEPPADAAPQLPISTATSPTDSTRARPSPADELAERAALWADARVVLNNFVREQLVQSVDFGTIKVVGRDGKEYESKLTLFKAGAEKIRGLFGWTPRYARDRATHEMLGSPPTTICYICRLFDEQGQKVGEGRGACTVGEGKIKTINSAIKMAQKRAQVDAVLSTAQLSEYFTQDLEDEPPATGKPATENGAATGAAPEDWAKTRAERDALTHEIEQMREALHWEPVRFGTICRTDYGKIVAEMDILQLRMLHTRMKKAVAQLKP